MDQIKVYDNFLNNDDLVKCRQIVKDGKWDYGHTSNGDSSNMNTSFFFMDLKHNDFFTSTLKEKIEATLGLKLRLERVYANGQTFGLDGCFHQDGTNSDTITFCLYLSPIPNEDIGNVGGNVYFRVPTIEHFTLTLEPRYNRGVSFPSTFFHKGAAFNRYVKNMRICVAWKLRIIS